MRTEFIFQGSLAWGVVGVLSSVSVIGAIDQCLVAVSKERGVDGGGLDSLMGDEDLEATDNLCQRD